MHHCDIDAGAESHMMHALAGPFARLHRSMRDADRRTALEQLPIARERHLAHRHGLAVHPGEVAVGKGHELRNGGGPSILGQRADVARRLAEVVVELMPGDPMPGHVRH